MTEALRTYLLYELRRIQAEIPRTPIGAMSTSTGEVAAMLTGHLLRVVAHCGSRVVSGDGEAAMNDQFSIEELLHWLHIAQARWGNDGHRATLESAGNLLYVFQDGQRVAIIDTRDPVAIVEFASDEA